MSNFMYVVVHFSGDTFNEFRQERIVPYVHDFYDHYADVLGSGYFNVHLRKHHSDLQCTLHLVAETTTFLVRAQNTHARPAFEKALHALTSQVRAVRDAAVKKDILNFVHEPLPERFTIRA